MSPTVPPERALGGPVAPPRASAGAASRRRTPSATDDAAGGAHVTWHDLECGGYRADLELWLSLAREEGGPVLDVGAGSGRVALHLAAAGVQVVALDGDPILLEALRGRAGELPVSTVTADARDFTLEERFALILAPMQTVQLLGGEAGRAAFLRCAARHLAPGGVLASAIADELEDFSPGAPLPDPDVLEREGWTWISQPTAVRADGERVLIERMRERIAPDGQRSLAADQVALDRISVARLEREAQQAGLRPLPTRRIGPTYQHVGSAVVMARG